MSCVVPGCKSNYKSQGQHSFFFIPKDKELREKWFRAIPRSREQYEENKYLQVCIHHFKDEDIERTFEYFDGEKTVIMPRDRMGLKNTAIPTIFPNCPSYLTDRTEKSTRVSRDDKDEIMLREAFGMSRIDDKTTVVKCL